MLSFFDKLTEKELQILIDLKSAELLNAFTQQDPDISEDNRRESSLRTQKKFSLNDILSNNELNNSSKLVRFINFCLRKFERFGPESLSGINHRIMKNLAPSLVHGVEKIYYANRDIYSAKTFNDVLGYIGRFMKKEEKLPGQYMRNLIDK